MLAVSVDACWLDICGMGYCAEYLTDGFISDAAIGDLDSRLRRFRVYARELIECGRWERVEGGYRIHDYLHYNPSAAEAAAEEQRRVESGRAGGERSVAVRRQRYGSAQPKREAHHEGLTSVLEPQPSKQPPKQVLRRPRSKPRRTLAEARTVSEGESPVTSPGVGTPPAPDLPASSEGRSRAHLGSDNGRIDLVAKAAEERARRGLPRDPERVAAILPSVLPPGVQP